MTKNTSDAANADEWKFSEPLEIKYALLGGGKKRRYKLFLVRLPKCLISLENLDCWFSACCLQRHIMSCYADLSCNIRSILRSSILHIIGEPGPE